MGDKFRLWFCPEMKHYLFRLTRREKPYMQCTINTVEVSLSYEFKSGHLYQNGASSYICADS